MAQNRGILRIRSASTGSASTVTMRAFAVLGLEETAGAETIKAQYKILVKRNHPDANGGDRSCEEKLREIIHAYKTLRAARLV
jgi:curved DNA-binding protein CbpA